MVKIHFYTENISGNIPSTSSTFNLAHLLSWSAITVDTCTQWRIQLVTKHEANNDEPAIILARSQHVASGTLDDYTNPSRIPRGIKKIILISPTYMGNLSFKVSY